MPNFCRETAREEPAEEKHVKTDSKEKLCEAANRINLAQDMIQHEFFL
jgi:hypothetical protein